MPLNRDSRRPHTQSLPERGETEMKHRLKWSGALAGWSALILLLGFMTAKADMPCAPKAALIGELMGKFNEMPLTTATFPVEGRKSPTVVYFINPTTGTWTFVVFPPTEETDGKEAACILMAGKDAKPAKADDFKPKGPTF